MANAMRRLSCISEAIGHAIADETAVLGRLQVPSRERRPSLRELEDSALLFLERRKSSDSGIGSLQPDLYRKRGSIVTIGCKEGEAAARVQLHLEYDFQKSDFRVTVHEATVHTKVEEPLLWLLLDGEQRKELAVKSVHKDSFKFAVAYEELLERQLLVELVGNADYAVVKHGRCQINLGELLPAEDLTICLDLEPVHEVEHRCGELNLCLQWLPCAERLSVCVQQATGLPKTDGVVPNAFVKATLTLGGKLLKKKKTAVKKSNCPVWNEVLSFAVDARVLPKSQLELTILDAATNKPLGHLPLNESNRVWQEALRRPQQVSRWLPLAPASR